MLYFIIIKPFCQFNTYSRRSEEAFPFVIDIKCSHRLPVNLSLFVDRSVCLVIGNTEFLLDVISKFQECPESLYYVIAHIRSNNCMYLTSHHTFSIIHIFAILYNLLQFVHVGYIQTYIWTNCKGL